MSGLDLNGLFVQWLDAQHEELTKKGTRTAHAYLKALEKIRAFPDHITTPRQLNGILFVGAKLVKFLCLRLKKHCAENALAVPVEFENYVGDTEGGRRQHELDPEKACKRRKTTRYIPKRRSGPWAILVSLYTRDKPRRGLRKEEVVEGAEPHCDKSFSANPAARDFYSAWDGIKVLLKRGLVEECGRPKVYTITEEGATLAAVLLRQEGIQSSPERLPEMSFDNGIRVSPDSSIGSCLAAPRNHFSSPLREATVPKSQAMLDQILGDASSNTSVIGLLDMDQVHAQLAPVQEEATATDMPRLGAKPDASDRPGAENTRKRSHDAARKTYMDIPYDVWAPEDYEVVLLLDNREVRSKTERDFFYNKIVGRGVRCDVRALAVGDVLWVARHKQTKKEVVLNYVCERKRIDDLAGSIRDGRFAEQKARLKKSGITHIHYLVEEGGLMDMQRVVDMKASLETSISMVITVSNFYIQRFRKVDDTIDWLVAMTKVLERRYASIRLLLLKPRQVRTQEEYLLMLQAFREKFEKRKTSYECVHRLANFQECLVKSRMMTVKEIYIRMLMLVRGITFEKAILIQRHFPTPRALLEFYIKNAGLSEDEKGELMLEKFQHELGARKFNKPSLVAMYEAWGKDICSAKKV